MNKICYYRRHTRYSIVVLFCDTTPCLSDNNSYHVSPSPYAQIIQRCNKMNVNSITSVERGDGSSNRAVIEFY
jgi:hypothetical protein